MSRFRRKPSEIDAEQYLGKVITGVCECALTVAYHHHVHTAHLGQAVSLEHGDWIIKEPIGPGYYPCKPDIFTATYEPA